MSEEISLGPTTPGHVDVTFNAGGGSSEVDPEPIRAVWVDKEARIAKVTWDLKRQLNIKHSWRAEMSNVVLCDAAAPVEDFTSLGSDNNEVWEWTFKVPEDIVSDIAVAYEIFFIYRPKGTNSGGNPLTKRTSFRVISGLDPTIILPPDM